MAFYGSYMKSRHTYDWSANEPTHVYSFQRFRLNNIAKERTLIEAAASNYSCWIPQTLFRFALQMQMREMACARPGPAYAQPTTLTGGGIANQPFHHRHRGCSSKGQDFMEE